MARKLTDEELGQRTRTMQRLRSERQRQRMQGSGKTALTVWIDASVKTILKASAKADKRSIAETAESWLLASAEREGKPITTTPTPITTTTPKPSKTPVKDARLLRRARVVEVCGSAYQSGVRGKALEALVANAGITSEAGTPILCTTIMQWVEQADRVKA